MNSDMTKNGDYELPADNILYEYAVIRYVPRVEREEFINIGLIMMCKRRKWLHTEIRINRERILAICPAADLSLLNHQAELFLKKDVPACDIPVEETYRWLTAAKSAILQTSPSHPGLATAPLEETFSHLIKELVE